MSTSSLLPVKTWSIRGNDQWLDGGAMFGNAPRAVWEKWIRPDNRGRIPLACRALLVEIGKTKILCETGIGCFFDPQYADRYGVQSPDRHLLLENLEHLGVTENDIDHVILSHLHFDHAGGLLPSFEERQSKGDRLLFPKAQYWVGKTAWERALHPHARDRASFIPELVSLLKESGRLQLIDGDHMPGSLKNQIRFLFSDGHTPGQMHTHILGPNGQMVFAGDLVPGRAWVHLPITMGYDRYPELLIDEKTRLYGRVSKENWWVFFTHDTECSAAHIELVDGKKYQATSPQAELEGFAL